MHGYGVDHRTARSHSSGVNLVVAYGLPDIPPSHDMASNSTDWGEALPSLFIR